GRAGARPGDPRRPGDRPWGVAPGRPAAGLGGHPLGSLRAPGGRAGGVARRSRPLRHRGGDPGGGDAGRGGAGAPRRPPRAPGPLTGALGDQRPLSSLSCRRRCSDAAARGRRPHLALAPPARPQRPRAGPAAGALGGAGDRAAAAPHRPRPGAGRSPGGSAGGEAKLSPDLISDDHPLTIVVGSGGVGKTTLAAAVGVLSARSGRDTLVMTFDPSLRLKDALGVGEEAREREVPVALEGALGAIGGIGGRGRLDASLLDAQQTFNRLIARYAPDEASRRRILDNRFYRHLSGSLGGILEYMAVERLFEVTANGRYGQIVLDTPPTRQALDFLEAPARIVGFLDSGP